MKYIYILVIFFVVCSEGLYAQQDPQYTQYMYNQAIINPAYAGSNEYLQITTLYRNQWTGFPGAPKTITFSGHGPLSNQMGLGVSVISDQHGPVKENNIYTDISYTIKVNDNLNLALGIKGGITIHDIGLASVNVVDDNDPFFSQNINENTLNLGAGAFLYTNNYYVGVSMPNMLQSVHLNENGIRLGSEALHYFVTAGYVFQLDQTMKFKPSFMVKSTLESPVSFDINANFLLFEKLELGASYRYQDALSFLINFPVFPNIRLGYAYDYVVSDINYSGPSSHEVFLQFDLNFSSNRKILSPRFF